MSKIFSPGKLLLTSEYVVLDGALALAVPTKLGQEFFFKEEQSKDSVVYWKAYHQNKLWLEVEMDYTNWKIIKTNHLDAANFIVKVLQKVQQLSKNKFKHDGFAYTLQTNLQFPSDYGWGGSSTLMNNLAEWAHINSFELNAMALGGSGYDIAVAKEKQTILYQLNPTGERTIIPVKFNPSFKNELLLVHLNRKQNSREGIAMYINKPKSIALIQEMSALTREILASQDNIEKFSSLMSIHEEILSTFLVQPAVKEKYFSELPVFVKSLGAWGGDFVLTMKFEGYKKWFRDRNFQTVLEYEDAVNA